MGKGDGATGAPRRVHKRFLFLSAARVHGRDGRDHSLVVGCSCLIEQDQPTHWPMQPTCCPIQRQSESTLRSSRWGHVDDRPELSKRLDGFHETGISILASRSAPLYTKRPSAWAGCVRGSWCQLPTPSAAFTLRSHMPEATGRQGISWTPLPCCASPAVLRSARRTSARRQRQGPDPLQHRPEQASGQMTARQQQPVVPRVFHQAPSRLDEALLETGERPRVDPRR